MGQPANPGSPEKMAVKMECVCVCMCIVSFVLHCHSMICDFICFSRKLFAFI